VTPGGSSGLTTSAGRVTAPPPKWLVFAITATGILANPLIAPAIPDILDDLGAPRAQAGFLLAAGTLPGIVVAPIIGVLADRYGRRAVLLPCLVLFGLFGVGASFAPSFWVLLALRLGQGIGSAGLINLAVVLVGDHWDGVDRARILGQNAAILTVSLAILPPLGGFLTELGGWRLAFTPYALGLVTAAVLWRLLPRTVPTEATTVRSQLTDALAFARSRAVVGTVALGFVIFFLIFGLFLTVLPLLVEDRFGLDAGGRGLVLAVPAITSTIAALSLGRLQARLGRARLILLGSVLFTIGFAIIAGAPALWVVVVAALVYGFGEGMSIPSLQDVVAGAAPASSRGAVVALWVGSARAGQTTGPLVAGAGAAAIGDGAIFAIGAGMAALLVVGQLVAKQDPRPA
jgi:MFS family permease